MAVYLLERIKVLRDGDGRAHMSVGYDAVGYEEPYAVVVRAYSAALARRLVAGLATENGKVWLDPKQSKITQIVGTGKDKVILVAATGA